MGDFFNSISDYKVGVLTKKEGVFYTTIIDAEADPFNCEFLGDNSVRIIANSCGWIQLSKNNLKDLIRFIKESEK